MKQARILYFYSNACQSACVCLGDTRKQSVFIYNNNGSFEIFDAAYFLH